MMEVGLISNANTNGRQSKIVLVRQSGVMTSVRVRDQDASMDKESDQAPKGHLEDALACTGDEGRGTLR